MSNPVQAKALSAERPSVTLDRARRVAREVTADAAIFVYDMELERALATIAERDERIAAVEKLCDERHALAAEQFGDEIEAQYVMLDEAEIRSALKGKP